MTTIETRRNHVHTVAAASVARIQRDESLSDYMLSITAIGGAIIGAVGGIVLGAEFGTAFPVTYGTLGTMLGSGLFAGVWCLLDHFRSVRISGKDVHPDHNAAEVG